MDLSVLNPVVMVTSLIMAATPLLFAALGELVVEKSGVLNLGVEGMMIVGAIAGFATTVESGSPWLGLLMAMAGGAALGLLFGFLTQVLMSNQVATGLALTIFGLGIAAMLGQPYSGVAAPGFPRPDFGALAELPVVGPIVFGHDWLVYLSIILVAAVAWFLNKTRAGLVVRAVGENHDAAHAIGYSVVKIRLAAIAFGGAMAGLGGAFLALVQTPLWLEGMTAGRGWIALAIVVFAAWKPWRALLGAYLFGGVTVLQLNLQAIGVPIGSEYLSMAPYIVTIVVLVIISADETRARLNAPASLGKVFTSLGHGD
jgi:general nucleoside transport system permease protein